MEEPGNWDPQNLAQNTKWYRHSEFWILRIGSILGSRIYWRIFFLHALQICGEDRGTEDWGVRVRIEDCWCAEAKRKAIKYAGNKQCSKAWWDIEWVQVLWMCVRGAQSINRHNGIIELSTIQKSRATFFVSDCDNSTTRHLTVNYFSAVRYGIGSTLALE